MGLSIPNREETAPRIHSSKDETNSAKQPHEDDARTVERTNCLTKPERLNDSY
jgi:hypothetical protein